MMGFINHIKSLFRSKGCKHDKGYDARFDFGDVCAECGAKRGLRAYVSGGWIEFDMNEAIKAGARASQPPAPQKTKPRRSFIEPTVDLLVQDGDGEWSGICTARPLSKTGNAFLSLLEAGRRATANPNAIMNDLLRTTWRQAGGGRFRW